MKWGMCVLCGMLLCMEWLTGYTQERFFEPIYLEVGVHATTNILFHYKIRQVDRGCADLLAKVCNDTVLLVKAGRESLPVTNLSVYTADGRLHAFLVRCVAEPAHLWVRAGVAGSWIAGGELSLASSGGVVDNTTKAHINTGKAAAAGSGSTGLGLTVDQLDRLCQKAVILPPGHRLRNKRDGVSWSLRGCYAYTDRLFLALELSNRSALDYYVQRVRCLIQDKRRSKRTATQERDILPAYVWGVPEKVMAGEKKVMVLVIPVPSVEGHRRLRVLMSERGAGRDLAIDLRGKRILHAVALDVL